MVSTTTYISDTIKFIRNDLLNNITDPISTTRSTNSKFVMTSYPQRPAEYPLITVRHDGGASIKRLGMRSELIWMSIPVEVRVWARNEKEKDTLTQQVINRLRSNQFGGGASTSDDQELHDFDILSQTPIYEEGGEGEISIKSMVISIQYNFVLGS